jgi:hypothetical protein
LLPTYYCMVSGVLKTLNFSVSNELCKKEPTLNLALCSH